MRLTYERLNEIEAPTYNKRLLKAMLRRLATSSKKSEKDVFESIAREVAHELVAENID